MKIKNGFVSNSSSSSFVYLLKDFDIDSIDYDWALFAEKSGKFEKDDFFMDDPLEWEKLSETEALIQLGVNASMDDALAAISKCEKLNKDKLEDGKIVDIEKVKKMILETLKNDYIDQEDCNYFYEIKKFINKLEEIGLAKCLVEIYTRADDLKYLHFIRENVVKEFFKRETKNEN